MVHGAPGVPDYLGPVAGIVEDLCLVHRYDQRGTGRSPRVGEHTIARRSRAGTRTAARPASLDAGKRLAQRVETHSAQAERLGVKVLEAEGSSGPCHGILPGLQPGPFTKGV
jgi:pimeloyl-ACP methyl ester carboxylesterase